MTDSREDLWLRFLASRTLTTDEKRDLLQALESDVDFRKSVLDDAELHGLLRAFGASDRDAEGFLKGVSDLLSADNDETNFINRLDARLEREGLLSPTGELRPGTGAPGKTHKEFRSDFGKSRSVEYNSSRQTMPVIVNLEGSEEDFAKLLILHRIIDQQQLTKALENRQSAGAKDGAVEPLRDTLMRMGMVSSSLIFEVLRVASKVVEECTKCGAVHHIYFFHPHARFFCAYCKGPLRLTDSGQALKWTPAQVAEAAAKAAAAAPSPQQNPLDEPSVVMPASAADETVFDLGTKVRSKPEGAPPLLRPAQVPPPAAAKAPPRPAALPPQVKPAPFDPTITVLPFAGDETMLDMGSTPKSKTMKPASAAPLPPAAPPPKAPAQAPDVSISRLSIGDETMLDMGETPKPKTMKPASAQASAGKPAPAMPALPDQTITPLATADETMLDMGSTPKSKSMPPAAPTPPPPAADATEVLLNDVMDTMLDMGSRPKGKAAMLPGEKPDFPVVPKAQTEDVADFTTSVIPGGKSRRAAASDAAAKGNPEAAGTSSTVDPTMMMTPPSMSAGNQGSTGTMSNVDKTQIQHSNTPKSGSGMGSAALSNAKAMPEEARSAAKDPNRIFGKYVLLNELGRGGAGVVYKAWDTLLLQYVALKFIRNQDDSDSDSTSGSSQIEEFQREARMSVRLRHPNIVRIYEMGCMSNRYYLSMEYIEGGTLLAMIHGGKERNQKTRFNSNPEQFLKIMINISLAVDYAHHEKQSVIHRDLKPHNVLVDKTLNPYVVDFGLAKEVDSGEGATLTGVVKGTPTYMAPEQAEGRNRDVDIRTDCYALGAILYEMLTGRPPFLGESVPEILRKIATELPERPNEVITKTLAAEAAAGGSTTISNTKAGRSKTKALMVPKALETICLKALEKNKADRYQTAKEFAEDIDRYIKGEDILASEPNLWRRFRRTVRKHPILSAAAAAILLATGTGLIAMRAARGTGTEDRKVAIERNVKRGDDALKAGDWPTVKLAEDELSNLEKNHPKVAEFKNARDAHDQLLLKTERDWNSATVRINNNEPLAKVLPALREIYGRAPELQAKFKSEARDYFGQLQTNMNVKASELFGKGEGEIRKSWVSEAVKNLARSTKAQLDTLKGLNGDSDFPFATTQPLTQSIQNIDRVIAYQGTWALQVNVSPYAEVTLLRADREMASEYTPIGLQELEVVESSSYIVELAWPSRKDSKITMKQEVKDLHHGQIVVIRGDLSKEAIKLERR